MLKLGRVRRQIDLSPRKPRLDRVKAAAFYYEVRVRADVDAVRYWCGVRRIFPIIRSLVSGTVSIFFGSRDQAEMFRTDKLWEDDVIGAWKTPRVRRAWPFTGRDPI